MSRSQKLHANRACIEAYHYSQTALKGEIDASRIHIDSRIDNNKVTQRLITRVSGKTIETIETFSKPLPTSFWMTYLPDRIVAMLANSAKLFRKVLVVRTMVAFHLNEYDGPLPLFQMTAVRYPVSSITITLNFPVLSAPADDQVDSFLITAHAVQSVSVVPAPAVNGRKVFKATLNSLTFQQTFRMQWSNERLEALRQSQPNLFIP